MYPGQNISSCFRRAARDPARPCLRHDVPYTFVSELCEREMHEDCPGCYCTHHFVGDNR